MIRITVAWKHDMDYDRDDETVVLGVVPSISSSETLFSLRSILQSDICGLPTPDFAFLAEGRPIPYEEEQSRVISEVYPVQAVAVTPDLGFGPLPSGSAYLVLSPRTRLRAMLVPSADLTLPAVVVSIRGSDTVREVGLAAGRAWGWDLMCCGCVVEVAGTGRMLPASLPAFRAALATGSRGEVVKWRVRKVEFSERRRARVEASLPPVSFDEEEGKGFVGIEDVEGEGGDEDEEAVQRDVSDTLLDHARSLVVAAVCLLTWFAGSDGLYSQTSLHRMLDGHETASVLQIGVETESLSPAELATRLDDVDIDFLARWEVAEMSMRAIQAPKSAEVVIPEAAVANFLGLCSDQECSSGFVAHCVRFSRFCTAYNVVKAGKVAQESWIDMLLKDEIGGDWKGLPLWTNFAPLSTTVAWAWNANSERRKRAAILALRSVYLRGGAMVVRALAAEDGADGVERLPSMPSSPKTTRSDASLRITSSIVMTMLKSDLQRASSFVASHSSSSSPTHTERQRSRRGLPVTLISNNSGDSPPDIPSHHPPLAPQADSVVSIPLSTSGDDPTFVRPPPPPKHQRHVRSSTLENAEDEEYSQRANRNSESRRTTEFNRRDSVLSLESKDSISTPQIAPPSKTTTPKKPPSHTKPPKHTTPIRAEPPRPPQLRTPGHLARVNSLPALRLSSSLHSIRASSSARIPVALPTMVPEGDTPISNSNSNTSSPSSTSTEPNIIQTNPSPSPSLDSPKQEDGIPKLWEAAILVSPRSPATPPAVPGSVRAARALARSMLWRWQSVRTEVSTASREDFQVPKRESSSTSTHSTADEDLSLQAFGSSPPVVSAPTSSVAINRESAMSYVENKTRFWTKVEMSVHADGSLVEGFDSFVSGPTLKLLESFISRQKKDYENDVHCIASIVALDRAWEAATHSLQVRDALLSEAKSMMPVAQDQLDSTTSTPKQITANTPSTPSTSSSKEVHYSNASLASSAIEPSASSSTKAKHHPSESPSAMSPSERQILLVQQASAFHRRAQELYNHCIAEMRAVATQFFSEDTATPVHVEPNICEAIDEVSHLTFVAFCRMGDDFDDDDETGGGRSQAEKSASVRRRRQSYRKRRGTSYAINQEIDGDESLEWTVPFSDARTGVTNASRAHASSHRSDHCLVAIAIRASGGNVEDLYDDVLGDIVLESGGGAVDVPLSIPPVVQSPELDSRPPRLPPSPAIIFDAARRTLCTLLLRKVFDDFFASPEGSRAVRLAPHPNTHPTITTAPLGDHTPLLSTSPARNETGPPRPIDPQEEQEARRRASLRNPRKCCFFW